MQKGKLCMTNFVFWRHLKIWLDFFFLSCIAKQIWLENVQSISKNCSTTCSISICSVEQVGVWLPAKIAGSGCNGVPHFLLLFVCVCVFLFCKVSVTTLRVAKRKSATWTFIFLFVNHWSVFGFFFFSSFLVDCKRTFELFAQFCWF